MIINWSHVPLIATVEGSPEPVVLDALGSFDNVLYYYSDENVADIWVDFYLLNGDWVASMLVSNFDTAQIYDETVFGFANAQTARKLANNNTLRYADKAGKAKVMFTKTPGLLNQLAADQ